MHAPLLGWALVFASCSAVRALVQQAHGQGHLSPVLSWHPRNTTAHLPAGRVRSAGRHAEPRIGAVRGGGLFAGRPAMGACGICVAGSCFAAPGAQLCWCLRIQTGQAHLAMHTPRQLPQRRSALSGPHSPSALPPSIPPPCGSIPMGTSVLRAALKFPI